MRPESDFTPPSAWCPRPGLWHAADSEATEDEVTILVAAFVRALQPEIVYETGTSEGYTTAAIGAALAANGHGHLYAVEIDAGLAARAAQRCAGLPVTVTCGDSRTWEPPGPAGFAWIDSAFTTRPQEILRLPFIPGAIAGVHDTGPQHPVAALLAPLEESGVLAGMLALRTPRGVTFARVTR